MGVLAGAIMTMENPVGQALALLAVAALLAAGIATTRVMLIGVGTAGTLWVIPDTAKSATRLRRSPSDRPGR